MTSSSLPAQLLHEWRDLLPLGLRISLSHLRFLLQKLDVVVLVCCSILRLHKARVVSETSPQVRRWVVWRTGVGRDKSTVGCSPRDRSRRLWEARRVLALCIHDVRADVSRCVGEGVGIGHASSPSEDLVLR